MDIKLNIILLFATVAISCLRLDASDSCRSVTTIGADLATIEFAASESRSAYKRFTAVIYNAIQTVLAAGSDKIRITFESANLRAAARAQNESFDGLMLGIVPTLDAIAIFQPNVDIPGVVNFLSNGLQSYNDLVWKTIRAAQGVNYSESKAQVENLTLAAQFGPSVAIQNLFSVMLDGNKLTGADLTLISCIEAQAVSELVAASAAIFKEINIMLEALWANGTECASYKYSAAIKAAHEEAARYFDAEVVTKFNALRNLVIAEYLNKTGVVPGLFAIQATYY